MFQNYIISTRIPPRSSPVRNLLTLISSITVFLAIPLLASFSRPIAIASATTCTNDSSHWYARALGPSSSDIGGTGAYTTTWSNWSVDQSQGQDSNEAVWLASPNWYYSMEAGFYSGHGVQIPWTNSILPYYTDYNGNYEYDFQSPLPANTFIWMDVENEFAGNSSSMTVGSFSTLINGGFLQIGPPLESFQQGEVGGGSSPASWMGGGSGESFSGYWLSESSQVWNYWPSNSDCNNSPYWITMQGTDQWENGGY